MIQYPLDHRRVFDGGGVLDRVPTIRTDFRINLKNPLEALRPAHRRALLSRCAVFGRLCGFRAPAGRRDPGPMRAVGCEHPMEANEIQARRRHKHRALPECGLPEARSGLTKPARACGQTRDEIQWLEDYMSHPVAVRGFQRVADVAACGPGAVAIRSSIMNKSQAGFRLISYWTRLGLVLAGKQEYALTKIDLEAKA